MWVSSAKLSVTVPTLVIGLYDEGVEEWDVKSIEPNLKILKKSSKEFYNAHYEIIKKYIVDNCN